MFRQNKKTENKQQAKDSLIEKLVKQVESLEGQVVSLQEELEIERNKPKEGYEEAKRLIADLEAKKKEYRQLLDELYKYKDMYIQKTKETEEVKVKYQAELDKLISEIKTNIKK